MKKTLIFPLLILIGISITAMECEPEETCEQDEICETKFVTACCTEDDCVYKYDGKEYSEDQVGQLALDLGCGTTGEVRSASKEDLALVTEKLKNLIKKARK